MTSSFKEFLAEAVSEFEVSANQFKITDLGDGRVQIKSTESKGPTLRVISSVASNNLQAKKSFTLSNKLIDAKVFYRFKAAGMILAGTVAEAEAQVAKSIKSVNKDLAGLKWRQDTAVERKKAAAKFSASKQKDRVADLKQKYGAKTIDRVKTRQIGGDDGYQWNVIVDGKSIMAGLTKREADYEQEQAWIRIAKKEKLGIFA